LTVRVQTEDFDAAREAAALTRGRTDIGAVVTFTGLMRGERDGIELNSMTLEHYTDMTEAELGRIEAEARARFQLTDCIVIHRVGELRPGDSIVLVVTAAPHRQAAFDAAAFLMDYLKTRAPFWKKETEASGTGRWVDARESDEAAQERWHGPAKAAE
jgi:molybdopterin synthase catalytic subunit